MVHQVDGKHVQLRWCTTRVLAQTCTFLPFQLLRDLHTDLCFLFSFFLLLSGLYAPESAESLTAQSTLRSFFWLNLIGLSQTCWLTKEHWQTQCVSLVKSIFLTTCYQATYLDAENELVLVKKIAACITKYYLLECVKDLYLLWVLVPEERNYVSPLFHCGLRVNGSADGILTKRNDNSW